VVEGGPRITVKGFVYIEPRTLPPSRKHPKGRKRKYVWSVIDGVKRSEGAFDLMRDARARKRAVESAIADGTYGQDERANILFKDFWVILWEIFLNTLSPGALRQYGLSYRIRFLPFFGHLRLSQITPETVQAFVNSLGGLSPSYIYMIFGHFRSAMNTAVAQGYINRSPCRGIRLPRLRKTVKPMLEPSEVMRLVDITDFPNRALFALLGFSGIRIGEALALRRRHIKLERRDIRIEESWCTNTRQFKPPKTAAGLRTVDMLGVLESVLREYFESLGDIEPDSLLFPSPDNPEQPVSYQTIHGNFRKALAAAGLPAVTIHSLRHSFASVILASGVSINVLARNLGHSDPSITLRVYSHLLKEGLAEGLERADNLFRGEPENA
jgi:integrase